MTAESENKSLIIHSLYELTVTERALIERGILLAQSYDSFIFFIKGIIYEINGKHDDALTSYKKVVEMNPKCAAAYYKMGAIYQLKGENDKAISNYTSVIKIEPENFFAYYYRGISYKRRRKVDQAISDFKKALKIAPTMKNSFMKGLFTYQWILKLDYTLVKKKLSLLTSQEEKVLRLSSGIGERFVYDSEGTFLNLYSEPISGKTFWPDVKRYFYNLYYWLSNEYVLKKEYEKAIEYINRAINLNLNFGSAYKLRGLIYYNTNQQNQAIVDFKKAIEINSKDDNAYKYLAKIYKMEQLLSFAGGVGFLTYADINNMLPDDIISSDQIDDVILILRYKNINIIDETEQEELEIAKKMAYGVRETMSAIFSLQITIKEVINIGNKLLTGEIKSKDISDNICFREEDEQTEIILKLIARINEFNDKNNVLRAKLKSSSLTRKKRDSLNSEVELYTQRIGILCRKIRFSKKQIHCFISLLRNAADEIKATKVFHDLGIAVEEITTIIDDIEEGYKKYISDG